MFDLIATDPQLVLSIFILLHILWTPPNTLYISCFLVLICTSLVKLQLASWFTSQTYPGRYIQLVTFNGHFRILSWRYLPYTRPILQAQLSIDIPPKYGLKYGICIPSHLRILKFPLDVYIYMYIYIYTHTHRDPHLNPIHLYGTVPPYLYNKQ